MRVAVVCILLGLMVLVTALSGALAWVLTTEGGAAWLIGRAENASPQLSVGTVRGTLWSRLVLEDLTIAVGADEVGATRVEVTWEPRRLMDRVLVIDELLISELTVRAGASTASAPADGGAAIPLRVLVRRAHLGRVLYVSGEDTTELGPVGLSLALDGDRLTLADVSATGLGFDVSGRAVLTMGETLSVSAELDWATQTGTVALEGGGRIEGVLPTFQIEQALRVPFDASAEGEVRLGEESRVDLVVRWSGLEWPDHPSVRSPSGQAKLTGWLDAYTFDGSGTIDATEVVAEFAGAGSGTPSEVVLERLALSSHLGDLDVSGRVGLDPVTWTLAIEGTGLDPSVRLPEWPGSLAVSGSLEGAIEPQLRWTLSGASIEGVLRGQRFTAAGSVGSDAPGAWRLDEVRVEAGENLALVSGRVDRELDLDVDLNARELSLLWPEASGELVIEGRVTGRADAPGFAGTLSGRALGLDDLSVATLELSGDVALLEDVPVSVALRGEGVRWRDLAFDEVTGNVSGASSGHAIEIDARSERGSGRLRADGVYAQGGWSGRLSELSVDQPLLGAWLLEAPTEAGLGAGLFRLERACLRQGRASLCGSANVGSGADALEVNLSNFDLSVLDVFMIEGFSVRGLYDASLELSGPFETPTGRLTARGTATVLTVTEGEGPPLEIPIDQVEIEAGIVEQALAIQAALRGRNGAELLVDADVTEVWADDPRLRAQLDGRWTDMAVLSLLSPEVGEVTGMTTLDVTVGGSVRRPVLQGEVRWAEGQLSVPQWGLVIEDIQVIASSPDATSVAFEATGRAGEGLIDIQGSMELDPAAGWPMELSIIGNDLQVVRLPDAEVFVSPDLQVRTALPMIDVSGVVEIPRARLLLDEVPAQAVAPSTDTVVHGVEGRAPPRPLDVHADLRLLLGDDVTYSGAGLQVALTGEMGLVYQSGRNAIASGAVNLDGQYEAYGQTLTLDRGELMFRGPIDNPGLDVLAVRRIETTTVGVQLGGTLREPTTRMFSDPVMSEADALSYLLLGRPLAGTGDQESATLESAAVSMGLRQALPAIQRVGQSIGLDELSVRTTAADTGQLMAGKQITPRIYIRYTYGLFNRIGGLLMRFRLNDQLSLETRSGEYKAMDLLYTVEKD